MSRIFKSITLRETPLVLVHKAPVVEEPAPEEEEPAGEAVPEEVAKAAVQAAAQAASGEAMGIVADAREKAAAVMAAAGEEAARLRQEAYDEGFQQGFEDGQARGEAEGLERARGAVEEAAAEAERIVALARQQADAALAAAERQIVELALAVAGKVLAREVAENPTQILPLVRAALDRVQDEEQVTIRVHPGCYEQVMAARPELQAALSRAAALAVVADATLQEGDCIVETPYGAVDARVDTQLGLVKAALRDMLP